MISPVDEVSEEAAPVMTGPVWVMSPTEFEVRPPVRVVAPKEVAPPELVVRFTAVPATVRLPEAVTTASPVAVSWVLRLPLAVSPISLAAAVTKPPNVLFGLVSTISPSEELRLLVPPTVKTPVWVMSPTEVALRLPVSVVVPKLVAPPEFVVRFVARPETVRSPVAEKAALPVAATVAVSAPAAATETSWPENEVIPKNELPALFRVMSPVVEVIEDGAPVVIAPVWVMSPTAVALRLPVSVVVPKLVAPPEFVVRFVARPETVRSPVAEKAALPVAATVAVSAPAAATETSWPENEVTSP